MNDLGPEAKSLFAAARKAEGLPGPKRDRIKHAVLVQAATLGAASTVAGGAVAMSMAAKVTLVTVTAAFLGGGSVSVWAWKKHETSAHAARSVPARSHAGLVAKPTGSEALPKAEAPAPAPEPVPVPVAPQRRAAKPASGVKARPLPAASDLASGESPALAPSFSDRPLVEPAATALEPLRPGPDPVEIGRLPKKNSPVTEVTAHAVVKGAAADPVSLDAELNLLRQAQEDLRLGLPAQALYRIAEFDRRFPRARLDQERQAIEVIARCQVRPGPAAVARAQQFLRQAPLSPLAARVRSACQQEESRSLNETGARREQ